MNMTERKKAVSAAASHKNAARKSSAANACWPGFEPAPGKKKGEKGSCRPKAKQTKTEKKADQKSAAASRLSGQRT
jgi:hypothetical protein